MDSKSFLRPCFVGKQEIPGATQPSWTACSPTVRSWIRDAQRGRDRAAGTVRPRRPSVISYCKTTTLRRSLAPACAGGRAPGKCYGAAFGPEHPIPTYRVTPLWITRKLPTDNGAPGQSGLISPCKSGGCRQGGKTMNERATSKLFGFSLATVFLGMMLLNAVSY